MEKGMMCHAKLKKITRNALFFECNGEMGIVPRHDIEAYGFDSSSYSLGRYYDVIATTRFKSGMQVFFLKEMEDARLKRLERKKALAEEAAKPKKDLIFECSYDEEHLKKYYPDRLKKAVFTCYIEGVFIDNDELVTFLILTRKKPKIIQPPIADAKLKYNGELIDIKEPIKLCMEGILWNGTKWNVIIRNRINLNGISLCGVINGDEFSKEELFQMDEIYYDRMMNSFRDPIRNPLIFCHSFESLHKSKMRAFRIARTKSCNEETYESVVPSRKIGDITVSKVVETGHIFCGSREERQKYVICEYPEGTWNESRKVLSEQGLSQKGARWCSINMLRIFDNDYLPTEGYEYRITKVDQNFRLE